MATKQEVQNRVDALKKQVEDLGKRRAQLKSDRAKEQESHDQRKKSLGADALAGKDTVTASDALTRERVKIETLDEAITQADDKLRDWKQELSDNQSAFILFEVNDRAADLENSIVSGIKCLLDVIAIAKEIESKQVEFLRVAGQNAVRGEYRNAQALGTLNTREIEIILRGIQAGYHDLYSRAQAKR